MKDEDGDTENLNRAVWITAIATGGAMTIYMIVNTIVFLKCNSHVCATANAFIYHSLFLAIGLVLLLLTSYNYSRLSGKYASLNDWSDYADCVDSYMKITSYQTDDYETILTLNKVALSLACFILASEGLLFFSQFYIFCKMRKL